MARSIAEAQVLGEVFEFTQMLDVHVPAFLHLERCRLIKRLVRQRIAESAPLPPKENTNEKARPTAEGKNHRGRTTIPACFALDNKTGRQLNADGL